MAKRKNLTPDERARLRVALRELRDEVRAVRTELERRVERRAS
jgi:hypothetical protein